MGVVRFLIALLMAGVALLATIPVVLLGIPFWLVSFLTRAIREGVRKTQPEEVPWTELIDFVPEIGWRNRADVRARVRAERAFQITTDAEGWRGARSIDESEVLVFGDSFAFGHGVDDRSLFADRSSSVRMKALGANGYNMVQQLLWMERLRDRLAGKFVVWFAFYGNDLLDNLHPNFMHYRTPFVRERRDGEGWEIVTEHVREERWPFDPRWGYRDKIAEVCTPTFQSARVYSAAAFLVGRAREVCDSAGARLAVVGIPDPSMLEVDRRIAALRRRSSSPDAFDLTLPDRRFQEICTAHGVPFLALSGVVGLHDHLPNDCHWTPRGHAKVAQALERLYREAPDLRPHESYSEIGHV